MARKKSPTLKKTNAPAPRELVKIDELARKTGMTEAAIRGRIASGHWKEGEHYFRRGRRLMMDIHACATFWVEPKK